MISILFPMKIYFKNKAEIKTCPNIGKLKEFTTNRSFLPELLLKVEIQTKSLTIALKKKKKKKIKDKVDKVHECPVHW